MVRRFFWSCLKKISFLIAGLLILFALVLTLGRLTANYINQSKPRVLQLAARVLHQPVQIKEFSIRWNGISPEIVMRGVSLRNLPAQEYFTIEKLSFTLDLWQSLLHRTILPGRVALNGAHFALQQNDQGHWDLLGFDQFNKMSQGDIGLLRGLYWLASQPNVVVDNVDMDLRFHTGQIFFLNRFRLQVDHHAIVATGYLGDTKKQAPLRFVLQPTEMNNGLNNFSARFYLKVPLLEFNLPEDQLMLSRFTAPISIRDPAVQAEIWGTMQHSEMTDVRGTLSTNDLGLMNQKKGQKILFHKISSDFYWQITPTGWRVFLNHFNAQVAGKLWQTHQIVLLKQASTYTLHLDNMDVTSIKSLFQLFGYWLPSLQTWEKRLNPTAQFSDVSLNYSANPTGNLDFSLQTKFFNLITQPFEKFPGLNEASGELWLTPEQGLLFLTSQHAKVNYPYLFAVPIPDVNLKMLLAWKKNQNSWTWLIPSVQLDNDNLNFSGRFQRVDNQLSFFGDFNANNAGGLSNYTPHTVISPELQTWLAHAFEGGVVTDGHVALLHSENKPHFMLKLHVKDVQLKYAKSWPAITKLSGDLAFDDKRLQIVSEGGETVGNFLKKVEVEIPNLSKPKLQVHGAAEGDAKTGIQFLQQSPLQIGRHLTDWNGEGKVMLKLDLLQNLTKDKKSTVHGQIYFQNSNFSPTSSLIKISGLSGELTFKNDRIAAENLHGLLQQKPFSAKLHSRMDQHHQTKLEVQLQTTASPDIFYLNILMGKSAAVVNLDGKTISGGIIIPFDKQAIWSANFDKLALNSDAITEQQINIDPHTLPNLDFFCKACRLNQHKLGNVLFQLRKIPSGVDIDKFSVDNPIFSLQTKGSWVCQFKICHTNLNGSITHQHLDAFLREYGIATALLGGVGQMNFELQWLGGPQQFNWNKVMGNLAFHYVQGRIVKLSNTTESKLGLGRFLSLLSLQTIPENIFSGFRHLNEKGFEFDNFTGKVNIHNGVGYANNVEILGPVAWVKINGAVNFAGKKYDLTMHVIPNMTSSLPVIIGLATGPLGGAVSWLVNEILAPKINAIAAKEYRIQGSMSQPIIAKKVVKA